MACIIALTYVIVVCFELNLTATFIGIQYYPEIRLFLKKKKKKKKKKPTKHDLRNFEQSSIL